MSGIIVNARTTDELSGVQDHIIGKFDFKHTSYDLMSKSLLTRVPPTTANIPTSAVFDEVKVSKDDLMRVSIF